MIKEFKKIWNRDRSTKKDKALKELAYIYHSGDYQSIYRNYHIDTRDATEKERVLNVGDIIEVDRGDPHQLLSITGGDIFEVSTQHFDDDSYRIKKGDSQNG